MALKNRLDPAQVADSLAIWWVGQHPDEPGVRVTEVQIPQASGMSSETVLFRLTLDRDGTAHSQDLVARVIPTGNQVFPTLDFARERLAMDAVRTSTGVPAPIVHSIETDASILGGPFLVMSRMYGETLADDPPFTAAGWLLELTADQQARLFDNALTALAAIHRADVATFGPDTLGHLDRGRPLVQHITHWQNLYDWTAGDRRHPTIDAGLAWINDNLPDEDSPTTLCWGDARLGNLMFGPEQEVTAALDWELASLGPAELDLAWFCFLNRMYTDGFGLPNPPGFPSQDQTVARYTELSGRPVRDFDFHEIYAGVRLSIVLMRLGTMMIEAGMLPADAALPIVNPPSVLLATLLGLPSPAAGAANWVTGNR